MKTGEISLFDTTLKQIDQLSAIFWRLC